MLAVLALSAACGGKKEPTGDCGKAIDNAITLSKDEYAKSGVSDATQPKIRAASLQLCKDDKWSNAVVVCLEQAKSTDDVITCQKQMTKDQQDNMAKAITAVIAADRPPEPPEADAPDAGTAGAADPGAAVDVPAGMPAECAEYKALIEKLAACDKLPAASRDMLKKSFDTTAKTWTSFDKLPDSARAALVEGCKQGADAVKQAAANTCAL